jgi:hypothetical protein
MTTMAMMIVIKMMTMAPTRANGTNVHILAQGESLLSACRHLHVTQCQRRLQPLLVAAEQRISGLEREKQQLLTTNEQT